MFGLTIKRHFIAAVASVLMSSIAVGSAVIPSQVSASPAGTEIVSYA